ncbi:hypothetical protein DICVIV_04299 [Dictyocaulus viviparus]|uniref:Uncharacterized protein n=1 Tax=Dictyocaulus viviparus TaxID=29172 RepID=A0A0D8Y0A4_DICVI|nr:hypothetical protein DICVIV_04299 [Dictyocaulus viviparus]
MTITTTVLPSLALLFYAVYQYQNDSYWWIYVPVTGAAGITCILPMPSFAIWRILSSVSIVGGTILMSFLFWTFHCLEGTVGYDLKEAGNLLPVALAVALSTGTRLNLGTSNNVLRYLQSLILVVCFILSTLIATYSTKYYFIWTSP